MCISAIPTATATPTDATKCHEQWERNHRRKKKQNNRRIEVFICDWEIEHTCCDIKIIASAVRGLHRAYILCINRDSGLGCSEIRAPIILGGGHDSTRYYHTRAEHWLAVATTRPVLNAQRATNNGLHFTIFRFNNYKNISQSFEWKLLPQRPFGGWPPRDHRVHHRRTKPLNKRINQRPIEGSSSSRPLSFA